MRQWLAWVLTALAATLPQEARAQSCHGASLPDGQASDVSARVVVGGLAATYENGTYEGEYQGLFVGGTVRAYRAQLDVVVPAYRLVRNGLTAHGLGDLGLGARVSAYRTSDGLLALGPELFATLPTGDEGEGLGMGHAMLMPGLFVALHTGKWQVLLQAAYGRSVGASEGHDGHALGALVNPMNRSELEHTLSGHYALAPRLTLLARVFGAIPIDVPTGRAREVLAAGATAKLGAVDLTFELHLPVLGEPFTAKNLLYVSRDF